MSDVSVQVNDQSHESYCKIDASRAIGAHLVRRSKWQILRSEFAIIATEVISQAALAGLDRASIRAVASDVIADAVTRPMMSWDRYQYGGDAASAIGNALARHGHYDIRRVISEWSDMVNMDTTMMEVSAR
jgi:hypothetical protein